MAELIFRIHRSELVGALDATTGAVSSKDSIPILTNVLLELTAETLQLRGTNLEVEVDCICDVIEAENGIDPFTVSAEALLAIAKNLPENAEISFEKGKFPGQITVRSDKSRYTLHTLSGKDFPSMASNRPKPAFMVSGSALGDAFDKVRYAIAKKDLNRAFLEGAHFYPLDDVEMDVVGCDGLSMAAIRVPFERLREFPVAIIPLKTIDIYRKLFGSSKAQCSVCVNEHQIAFQSGGTTLTSKLINGRQFPYQKLLPDRSGPFMVCQRDTLKASIARTCIIAEDTTKDAVYFTLTTGKLVLQLDSMGGESATDTVDVDYEGDEHVIGFNGSFVKNMLGSVTAPGVRMYVTDSEKGCLFTPDNDAGESFMVMPMKGRRNA